MHRVLEDEAAALRPGESGLVALDWWNGNRSVLVDVDLTGLLVGATLATKAPEIYRALIEATAFGTRAIIDAFEANDVAVNEVVACGGLPERNRLLMQIYADVTGREFKVAASSQTPALGSAMFAAVAAGPRQGGYDSIVEAAAKMARLQETSYLPNPEHRAVYDELYRGVPSRCTTISGGRERRDEAAQGDQGTERCTGSGVITRRRGGGRPRSIAARRRKLARRSCRCRSLTSSMPAISARSSMASNGSAWVKHVWCGPPAVSQASAAVDEVRAGAPRRHARPAAAAGPRSGVDHVDLVARPGAAWCRGRRARARSPGRAGR